MMVTLSKSNGNLSRQRGFLAGFVVVINTYSWFFPLYILFEGILNDTIKEYSVFANVIGIHYLAALVSAFVGVIAVNKRGKRDQFLILWMIVGAAASLSLTLVPIAGHLGLYLISFLLGVSLGLGFPSFLAYFAEYNTENVGKKAGTTFLLSGVGILAAGSSTALLPFAANALIFAAWRIIGCILFLFIRPTEKKEIGQHVSYRSILDQRAFILYFIPWIMYCIINYLEASLLKGFFGSEFSYFVPVAEFGIGGIVAFVAGYLSDLIGRKIVIAFGFVMLGIGYAFLGLFPGNMISWYFYVVVDGVSLGVFALAFFIVIWGELAGDKNKEKYYLLGGMPYLVLSYLGIVVRPYVELMPVSSAFSLAAFFLFLAVLPLMYAPETLSEKKMKDRELKKYIEKARKAKEKYA